MSYTTDDEIKYFKRLAPKTLTLEKRLESLRSYRKILRNRDPSKWESIDPVRLKLELHKFITELEKPAVTLVSQEITEPNLPEEPPCDLDESNEESDDLL